MFVATKDLFQQAYLCRDERRVCRDKRFVSTSIFVSGRKTCLSRQKICFNKHICVATKDVFCRDKSMLVATNIFLSRQIFVVAKALSRQTFFSRQNVCHDKHTFVTTKDVFSRDNHVTVETCICRDKTFENYVRPRFQTKTP